MTDSLKVAIVEHDFTLVCQEAARLTSDGMWGDVISAVVDLYASLFIDCNMYIPHLIHDRIQMIIKSGGRPKEITFLRGCGVLELCCILSSRTVNPKEVRHLKYDNVKFRRVNGNGMKDRGLADMVCYSVEEFSAKMGFDSNLIGDMIAFVEDVMTVNCDTIKMSIVTFLRKHKSIRYDIIHNATSGIPNSQKKDPVWILWIICIFISKKQKQVMYITECMLKLFSWKYKRSCREIRMNLLLFSLYNATSGLDFVLEYNSKLLIQSYTKGHLLYETLVRDMDSSQKTQPPRQRQRQQQQQRPDTVVKSCEGGAASEGGAACEGEAACEAACEGELGGLEDCDPLFVLLERDEESISNAKENRLRRSNEIKLRNKMYRIELQKNDLKT